MIPHSRPKLTNCDLIALQQLLAREMLNEGYAATTLEKELAKRCGFADVVVVGSGCQALMLALRSRGVKHGSGVVVPTYVCPEVLGVVEALGALPILADIDESYGIDPADAALTSFLENPVVVLPWLFGQRLDMGRYPNAAKYIVDWAQYWPSSSDSFNERIDLAIMSFEATKMLAGGEGGAILCRNKADAETIRSMKCLSGSSHKLNLYPMSDLQATLILSQLKQLSSFLDRRLELANKYDQCLSELRCIEIIQRDPDVAPFRYVVRLKVGADRLFEIIAKFADRGVAVRRPVSILLHQIRPVARKFPTAQCLFEETLSLPLYPALDDAAAEVVIQAAIEVLRQ